MLKSILNNSVLILVTFLLYKGTLAQEFSKDSIQGLWKICGDFEIDEKQDTLLFTRTTPECLSENCATHNWKFLPSGTVTFIFTDGCESGFHSKNKPSKKWLFKPSENLLLFITNDGWKEVFEIISLHSNELILVHRFDLEN